MQGRIAQICAHLMPCRVFADVGCDHGYLTQYMLENDLCERAYISDISSGSLKKAATLLKTFVDEGKCIPVCADGLEGIPEPCDLILIAGMGGEEIVHILENRSLPQRFVLQPMKNAEKVRALLLAKGAHIEKDFTFGEEGYYYDLICGISEGRDSYTANELRYGRDNLKHPSPAFFGRLEHDKMRLHEALIRPNLSPQRRGEILSRLHELEEVTNAIEGIV